MTLHLKTVCPEFLGRIPEGDYTVDGNCSALRALRQCMEHCGVPLPDEAQLSTLMYMVNGRHCTPNTPVAEGDRLWVLRPLRGG